MSLISEDIKGKKKAKSRKIYDEDEEEDEEETRQSKRRRKLGNFILDEAAVDEDDEEEGYDLDCEDADLIDHPDDEAEVQDAIQHLQYDNRRELNNFQNFQNEEEIDAYYRNRYEENDVDDFGTGDAMASAISQQKCLPGVKDPNLWQVTCNRGEEKNAVLTLMNKFIHTQYTSSPLLIKSAFSKDNVSGFIYIESFKETHVKKAIEDIRHLYRGIHNLKMVSITEMTDVMKVLKSFKKLQAGQWVRVIKGVYKDDLAKVIDVEDAQNLIFLQLIPRIDYKKIKENLNRTRWVRPPQDMMTRKKIADMGLDFTKSGDRIIIRSQEFDEKGFLYKSFKLTHIQSERVNPEMHELEKFNETPGTMNTSSAMKKSLEDMEVLYSVGDYVEVSKGFLKDLKGKILSINGKTVMVLPLENDLKEPMSFQADELRKFFQPGNHVKVIQGKYESETGIVVAYDSHIVVVMSDMNVSQFKVQPRHLQICNQTNSGLVSSGNFQIGDLIQIDPETVGVVIKFEKNKMNVLTTANKVVSLNTSSNLRKNNSIRSCGLDADNNQIRPKDSVSVVDGIHSGQQGEVKHIYKSFSFLFNRNTTDNAGYISVKNRLLSKKNKGGSKSSCNFFKVPNLVPQSPRLHHDSSVNNMGSGGAGHDGQDKPKFKPPSTIKNEKRFVGSTARIIKGPLKGNIGIIKEIKADTATIELHSMFKTVKVVKENFALLNSSGRIIDSHFGAQSVRVGATGGTSAWGGRTPNYGLQTPMYGSGTPHYNSMLGGGSGGETPRHHSDTGGRTPHVGSGGQTGGQTPRHQFGMADSGMETPRATAFDPAGATPAHHAFDMFDDNVNSAVSGGHNNGSDQTPLSALSNSILDSPTVSGIYNQMNTTGFNSELDRESPGSMNLFSPVAPMPRTPACSNFNIFTPATPGNDYCIDSSNPYLDSGAATGQGAVPPGVNAGGTTSGSTSAGHDVSSERGSASSTLPSASSSGHLTRVPPDHLQKHVIVLARTSGSADIKRAVVQDLNGAVVSVRLPDEKRVISVSINHVYRQLPESGNTVIYFNADNTTMIGQCLTIDGEEVVVKINSDTLPQPLKLCELSQLEPYNE